MAEAAQGDPTGPLVAHLHPHRGPGVAYAALAVLVLVIVLAGTGTNLAAGHLVLALVTLVAGAGLTGFLALLAAALLGPDLHVGPEGVRGRTGWRQPVDLRWAEVGVDVDEDGPRGRFSLDLGAETFEVQSRSWVGFADLVLVLATTPAALERMTPAAIEELVRLLDVQGPATTADVPEG